MEPQNFTFIPLSKEQFKELLTEVVRNSIKENFQHSIQQPQQDDELLKIADVARIFKVSKVTIHQWMNDGILPEPIRKKSRVFFKKNEILDCLNQKKQGQKK